MPTLRAYVGACEDDLKPVEINDGVAHWISNDFFEGNVAVFLKMDDMPISPYFASPDRDNSSSWSIQVQGRFLQERSASHIYVTTMFAEKPGLPWGISAIMQFVRMLDPTLADDLSSEKPWIMSPLLSAMPFLKVEKIEANSRWPEFPAAQPFVDNCHILQAPTSNIERRKYFRDPAKRSEHTFGPELLLTADFVHGHVHFPSLKISFPGGIELQSTKYWHEGQRVMLAGCEKAADGSAGPGRTFFCVAFEIVPE